MHLPGDTQALLFLLKAINSNFQMHVDQAVQDLNQAQVRTRSPCEKNRGTKPTTKFINIIPHQEK